MNGTHIDPEWRWLGWRAKYLLERLGYQLDEHAEQKK